MRMSHATSPNRSSRYVLLLTTPRTSFILTSLEVRRATGHFRLRVKLMQKGREGYSLLSLNWNCTNASMRQIGEFCLSHSSGNETGYFYRLETIMLPVLVSQLHHQELEKEALRRQVRKMGSKPCT